MFKRSPLSFARYMLGLLALVQPVAMARPPHAPYHPEPRRPRRTRFKPFTDDEGITHGIPGAKLARKAAKGTVTLRHGR